MKRLQHVRRKPRQGTEAKKPVSLRVELSPELYDWLVTRAKAEDRTIQGQARACFREIQRIESVRWAPSSEEPGPLKHGESHG